MNELQLIDMGEMFQYAHQPVVSFAGIDAMLGLVKNSTKRSFNRSKKNDEALFVLGVDYFELTFDQLRDFRLEQKVNGVMVKGAGQYGTRYLTESGMLKVATRSHSPDAVAVVNKIVAGYLIAKSIMQGNTQGKLLADTSATLHTIGNVSSKMDRVIALRENTNKLLGA